MMTRGNSAKYSSSSTEEAKFLSHTSMERHTGVGIASYASFSPIFTGYNREPRDVALFNSLYS